MQPTVNDSIHIGVFGGSFDPPHIAHFICSRIAAEWLGLSKLLVIPTATQPCKPAGTSASAELRCEMIQALIRDDPLFELSRIEIDRGGISYTVDTLKKLIELYPSPEYKLHFLIGADAMSEMYEWRDPEAIFSIVKVAVMMRPGTDPFKENNQWAERALHVEIPRLEISSTTVRQRIAVGLSVTLMVGSEVDDIIRRNRLYQIG